MIITILNTTLLNTTLLNTTLLNTTQSSMEKVQMFCCINISVMWTCALDPHLRRYIVRSELWSHQVALVDFGKAKITQFHGSVLTRSETESMITIHQKWNFQSLILLGCRPGQGRGKQGRSPESCPWRAGSLASGLDEQCWASDSVPTLVLSKRRKKKTIKLKLNQI